MEEGLSILAPPKREQAPRYPGASLELSLHSILRHFSTKGKGAPGELHCINCAPQSGKAQDEGSIAPVNGKAAAARTVRGATP